MASTTLTPDRASQRQAGHDGGPSGGETVRVRRLPRAPSLGLLTLVLLAAALLAPVASLVAADWVDHLDRLFYVTLGGILLGYLASQIRLPELVVHPIALVLGTIGVFYVVASTLPQASLGPDRMIVLWRRLETWVYIARLGGFGDPTLFLLLLGATALLIGYLGAWFVFRDGTAWWPLVVAGAILVINVSYAPELIGYVLPFAVTAVLLIARVNLHRQEQVWYARGLPYTPNLFARTLPVMILLATLFTAFGWYMPEIPPSPEVTSALDDSAPIQRVQTEFNRFFRGIRGRGSALPAISGFGTSMQLGGNFTLANYPILQVYATEGGYWRAVVYERYDGHGWSMDAGRGSQTQQIAANATQPGPSYEAREEVTQRVELIQPRGDTVVGAAQIRSVSIATSAAVVRGSQGQARGNQYVPDASLLRSSAIGPGSTYTVVSQVSRATPDQLRRAGGLTTYPRDVISRYTQLPEMPYRVESLATGLTRGQASVYDQAKAVETYLHTLKYSTQVTPPPADRDAVDYFLFDLKEGYCDYYASAMTVMLRSVGIPARVVSGYAAGQQSAPGEPFVVRDSNAHSWVEVYFPRYGWFIFDPTPGGAEYAVGVNSGLIDPTTGQEAVQPGESSPPDSEPLPPDLGSTSSDTSGAEGAIDLALLRTAALTLLTLGVLAAALALLWFSGFAGLPAPAAAYARTTQLASLLGWRPQTNETPHEFASRLGQQAPGARPALGQIVDAFVALRFGGRPRRLSTAGLDQAWQSVRRGLLDAAGKGVLRRLPRWR